MPPANGISSCRDTSSPNAIVPSWQLRHNFDAPVGCPTMARMLELWYCVYAAAESSLFHNRPVVVRAPCGVWQKIQISCSVVDFIEPGPDIDRLCFVVAISALVQPASNRAEKIQKLRCVSIFTIESPGGIEIPEPLSCNCPRHKFGRRHR